MSCAAWLTGLDLDGPRGGGNIMQPVRAGVANERIRSMLFPTQPSSTISAETLAILCSPLEHAALCLVTDVAPDGETRRFLVNDEHRLRFPIRNGIPIFVEDHQITGINRRFRRIYDGCAPFYDLLSRVGLYLLGISERELRTNFVASLEVDAGDLVLATSVGTGADLQFIRRDCRYYGLDLSAGMLEVCQRRLPQFRVPVELVLGQAEYLPFKDRSLDVVYQMGGINFFTDQERAIREMVRVAKNGSKIVLMDETEKVAKALEKIPGINAWFNHTQRPIIPPLKLVPEGMREVEFRELYDGLAWYLSFRKPL